MAVLDLAGSFVGGVLGATVAGAAARLIASRRATRGHEQTVMSTSISAVAKPVASDHRPCGECCPVETDSELRHATAFADGLAGLTAADWLRIGRTVLAGGHGRSQARAALDAALAERGLRVQAWYVRDAVKTASFVPQRATGRLSRAEARMLAAAREAAEDAALAVLAAECLAPDDCRVLMAPFSGTLLGCEHVVPSGEGL